MKRERPSGWMKIGEFSERAGVARSTLHYYVDLGLLPPPDRRGPKLHLWGPPHRRRLKEIALLRDQGGYRLSEIRARLAGDRRLSEEQGHAGAGEQRDIRTRLLHAAAQRFAERGYHDTRLEDVAAEVGLSKAAIYRHVESKEGLFVECIGLIRHVLVPSEVREVGANIDDPLGRARARVTAVLEHFVAYRKLTSLLGDLALGEHGPVSERARAELHAMVENARPELQRAMDGGQMRRGDAEFDAYVLWGAVMGLGDWLELRDASDAAAATDAYLDLILNGLLPRGEAPAPDAAAIEVRDLDGVTTLLTDPCFDGRPGLQLRRGRGTLEVDVHGLRAVRLEAAQAEGTTTLVLIDAGGASSRANAPSATVVSGVCAAGRFEVSLGALEAMTPSAGSRGA